MSSSRAGARGRAEAPAKERKVTGRVIVGLGMRGPSEMTLAEAQGVVAKARVFDEKTEAELLARVRERAREAAREILAQAMAEAAAAREQARREGYEEGRAKAGEEIARALAEQAGKLAGLLGGLQSAGQALWQEQKGDLVALVRLAVEKLLRIELDARREEVLGSLLEQALEAIDSSRGFTVRVAPGEEGLAQQVLEKAKEANPHLERWRIKADKALAAGGLLVESGEGMVDNSLAARMKAVEPILDRLGLTREEGA